MSVSQSAVARVTGIDVAFKNFNVGTAFMLAQRLAVIGQGNTLSTYSTAKKIFSSAGAVGAAYGYGSPLHLVAKQLFPDNNDGIKGIVVTFYPLIDDATGIVAAGDIGATGAATAAGGGTVKVGGIASAAIVIPSGSTDLEALELIKTAINAIIDVPAIAGAVVPLSFNFPLTAKWKGESGNGITIDISDLECTGLIFSTSAMAAGANNPDVDLATALIGEIWETMILNCMNYDDTTTLDKFQVYGEGRWDQLVKKPLVVAVGCIANFATRTAITDARKDDRINYLIESVGSLELPSSIAARGLAKDIISTANDNPPQNYKGRLTQLEAGADADQEDYATRDNAVKFGASTNIKTGTVTELADIVTFYHPVGEPIPAFRYVVDIVKLQQVEYNTRLIFESDDWKGAPLLPAGQPTTNKTAKTPNDAKTALRNLADSLALAAIISDADFTKENLTAEIDGTNPKRLNWTFPVKLSGNAEVISGDILFGFFLGT